MNERIKELAIQSGANVRKFKYQSTISVAFDDESFEKFAELIVRECLSIADRRGAYEVMDDIIEHFGVES